MFDGQILFNNHELDSVYCELCTVDTTIGGNENDFTFILFFVEKTKEKIQLEQKQ